MSIGRITGNIGANKSHIKFVPQGIAYPTVVSETLVQNLLGTYGGRSATGEIPRYKKSAIVTGKSAREVSEESKKYFDTAGKIVSGIESMEYAQDVIGLYPGGKTGLISEISDVFYLYLNGENIKGANRLSQVQAGFEESVELVTQQKKADLQSQIDYLIAMSDKMTRELPYGEAWFLETAEANTTAKFPLATTKKWLWEEEYEKEIKRLRWVASETETARNEYTRKSQELQGYADRIGTALSNMVLNLFNAVIAEIQIIAKKNAEETAIEEEKRRKKQEEESKIAKEKYCKEQTEAMNNYSRLSKEFNDALAAAMLDFNTTNAEFWVKVGI